MESPNSGETAWVHFAKEDPHKSADFKKKTQFSYHLHHGRTCRLSQEAQLGSQDELEGNHLRDLSVSLLSRTQFTVVS